MTGQGQTDNHVVRHRDGRGSLLCPVRAIRGTISRKGASTAHQLHPVGRVQSGGLVPTGAAAGARTVLPGHAIARCQGNKGVGRAGVQTLADHDSGFRPRIDVLHEDDAGNDGAIPSQG